MATAYRGFQLGLLPERKINKRALATAMGWWRWLLLILINLVADHAGKAASCRLSRDRTDSHAVVAAGTGADQDEARGSCPSCFRR